jgi:hypothetical protein
VTVTYFETLFRYLLGGTEENLKQVTQCSGWYSKSGTLDSKQAYCLFNLDVMFEDCEGRAV